MDGYNAVKEAGAGVLLLSQAGRLSLWAKRSSGFSLRPEKELHADLTAAAAVFSLVLSRISDNWCGEPKSCLKHDLSWVNFCLNMGRLVAEG